MKLIKMLSLPAEGDLVLNMLSRNVDYYRLAEIFIDYKKEMLET